MNMWIWLLSLLWWWEETAYFGWNLYPHSEAELFADFGAICLFALAIAAHAIRPVVNVEVNK